MRPAVYASVMRNRKTVARRVNKAPHQFSLRRFFLMLFVGGVMFVPGLIVTIIGIESADRIDEIPGDKVLYKFIGPASLACGVGLVLGSGIYYCCWGFQSPVSGRHARKRKKVKESGEQYDPLQAKAVPTIVHEQNDVSPRPISRSKDSKGREETPDPRSDRHGNGAQRHRTPSRSSLESQRSHQQNSRHRHSSKSRHSNNSHNSHPATGSSSSPPCRCSPPTSVSSQKRSNNQVTFINTGAPLAQGETGSMDISIDIDTDLDEKY